VSFRVVIPARFAATRLPGKPLRLLAGRPMVLHVLDRAREAGAAEVLVACDDERIRAAVEAAGGRAVMTAPELPSGTDRLAAVAAALGWPDDAVVVNLQGDEPLMPPSAIAACAAALIETPSAGIATLATPITTAADLFDPSVVKVVVDDAGLACLFSRAPLPWVRDAFQPGHIPAALPPGVPFLRHLGLYAYRVAVLGRLSAEPVRSLERAESLEQLRAIALGIPIAVRLVEPAPGHGVDTEADLARVEAALAARAAR
jgi:3-deoxy-manno-octulosonate cytidylyltransferase (CMP-KDO synthetase)